MKFNFTNKDIKYLKILFKKKDDSPLTIKAAVRDLNEREITACIKFEEDFDIEYPQEVILSIVCSDGLYRTKTKLKSYDEIPPYIVFYMDLPQEIEYQQNREYFRVPVQYQCMYYPNLSDLPAGVSAETCDISASGVSIILPELYVSKNDAELDIMVEEKLIHTSVKCVRSEEIEENYKLSFTFVNISNSDRDYISQVCIKKQLEHKRNGVKF